MGDVLAAIREKAHAHQVESKAKRFRDRGGLWQPLSPSKNKLMAFLNSPDLQNIIEDPPCAKPTESSKVTDIAHRSKERTEEKGKAIPPDDKPNKIVQNEVLSARPKTKGNRKAPQVSLAEKSLVTTKTVSGAKLRQKRKTATVSSDLTTPDGKTDYTQVQPQSATGHTNKHITLPRRSKRATNKRNLRELSDEEGVSLDSRPSPAKKPRTRAIPNTSKEAVKVRPVKYSVAKDKHSMQGNDFPIPMDSPSMDMPSDANPSRSLKHSLEPSDAEEPSSAKRRRTRNARQTKGTFKVTKESTVDHSDIDITSDNEMSKLRKRGKPASKAPTKTSSRKKPIKNCHEEPLTNSDGDVMPGSNKSRFPDVLHLKTIREEEEIEHNNGVALMGPMTSSAPVPQASGSKDRMQTLGMTKRRRKKVRVKADSEVQPSQVDQEVDEGLGASTKNSARCTAGPHTFHDPHRLPLEKDDLQVSKTQASEAHLTSKPKPRDNSGVSVTHHVDEEIGVVPPMKRSERKIFNSKVDEVIKPSKGHKALKELNNPRERHLKPEVDSDFDEIDFLT